MPTFQIGVLALSYLPLVAVRGLRPGTAAGYVLSMNTVVLWLLSDGPRWALPAGAAVSAACAAGSVRHLVRRAAAAVDGLDPAGLRALVRAAAADEGPGWIGLCVLPTGTLAVTALGDGPPQPRQFRVLPGPECRFCLLEEQIDTLLGDGSPLLDAYREGLRTGSARHVMIRRSSPEEPWQGALRERTAYRVPALRVPCEVHDALVRRR
ncbi:hypothetical protein [Kitasatospora sp. NPDC059571]|uniref:hypothetical protein n=1 Tax=Kitasatospora sp. NPDC059571 TaxID=3346871 RepID=UPI0036C50BEE